MKTGEQNSSPATMRFENIPQLKRGNSQLKTRTNINAGAACYTVKSGDSLSKISQMFYGPQYPANVDKIYQSNLATIGASKSRIYPGQKLYIHD